MGLGFITYILVNNEGGWGKLLDHVHGNDCNNVWSDE